jgi:hypothetical protein
MNVSLLLKTAVKAGRKIMPVVLLAAGTVLAVDAIVKTPEAYEEANEIIALEERKAVEEGRGELTTLDKVKVAWKPFVPVAWREGASLLCFYGAFYMKHRRGAALAALYSILQSDRDRLDKALLDAVGKDKYEEIRHTQMNNDIQKALDTKSKNGDQICVGNDEALGIYYEPISGKIFKADPRKISEVIKKLDERYRFDGFASLSDFFRLLSIDPPEIGNYVGWEYADGDPQHITYKTYDYHWTDKDIYITGLDMGVKIDNFVRTWW